MEAAITSETTEMSGGSDNDTTATDALLQDSANVQEQDKEQHLDPSINLEAVHENLTSHGLLDCFSVDEPLQGPQSSENVDTSALGGTKGEVSVSAAPSQRPETKDCGTMTPPVKFVVPKPRQYMPTIVDSGERKPQPPEPTFIVLAPPLIKIREPTQEEWEVEDVLLVSTIPI